jgi:ubiquinone biosynthesis protein
MPRRLRSVGRFRQIIAVLAKYGFDEALSRAHLPFPARARLRPSIGRVSAGPARLRLALEELGPTFIKLGQVLSTRSYLLPPDYAVELAKLQDRVSPCAFEDVEKVMREDLGESADRLFAEIDREPLASASIAQVHLATLASGERVCVKIQRPSVKAVLALDTMILKDLARLLEAHVPESRQYDPVGIVTEFERTSRREVDFTIEASSMAAFERNFADDPTIHIPRVFKECSSPRVLTTELIDGIKISEVDRLREAGLDLKEIARTGAQAVLKQVFEHGLFHADPHPGNLFVTCDGKIAPIDFGIVGRLTRDEISDLAELMLGIFEADSDSLIAVLNRLRMLPDDVDRREVAEDVMLLGEKYASRKLGELNMKELFGELVGLTRRYRVRMRTEFLLLGKALSIYEEVGRVLDPEFSMMEIAKPYVAKLMRRKHALAIILGTKGRRLVEALSKISSIPSDLARVLALAREGRLKIEFQHVGLEGLTAEIEKASNRLSFSLIVAALVVASSVMLVLGPDAVVYRLFAIGGFGIAALIGFWLLINIIRSGRM